ncbi:hypothetical protein [Mycobacterium aquaticum]|uniref:DNA helicase DnaB-like N-terminal domain-containing protein n=1 Tax=Mycobacterium aquaticum TaxID=1927124 RepID=A0A1X0AGU8_9MYCO|nr:hypothetical protein [Mycobacterium aquaticum]ORA29287.1 hypothetical protein BST13_27265 [Mycobacterium aquaticum]
MSPAAVQTLEPVAGDDSWLRMTGTDLEKHVADDWRAEAFVMPTESQHQLIGALLWLPATRARAILELVPDTAFWRPRARWACQLIRTLAEAGHDPHPVAVFELAQTQPSTFALRPDHPPTAHQIKGLAIYLFDAYQDAIAPHDNAGRYAATSSTMPTEKPSASTPSACKSSPNATSNASCSPSCSPTPATT